MKSLYHKVFLRDHCRRVFTYCLWFGKNLNRFGILNLKMIELRGLFSSSSSQLLTHQKLHVMSYSVHSCEYWI